MSDINFTISKAGFYNALQISAKAISPNSPIPALCGIKLDTSDEGLMLTSSDADISIQMLLSNQNDDKLGLSIASPGSIVIDSRYLLEIVRKIDSDEITIKNIDGTLTQITGGKAEFKINGYRPADFPTLDFSRPAVSFSMKSEELSDLVNGTVFAASSKETRPVLTGVNFQADGQQMVCTATDSYRLARKIIKRSSEPFNATIPARSLSEARTIFSSDEEVTIAVSPKKAQFFSSTVILQTRLLEGAYPETSRLIPSDFSYSLTVSRTLLIRAIDRTSFIRTENMPIIRLQMNGKDDVVISNKSQEIGESREDLIVEDYEGMPLDISFAGNYVLDAARTLTSENIKIRFTGDMKPFVLTNDGGDDTILQLVLPVRTYN